MFRLKCPGGRLQAAQLRQVAEMADEMGGGFADLTPDQEIQLYGIRREDEAEGLDQLQGSFQDPAESVPFREVLSGEIDAGVYEQNQSELFTIGLTIVAGRIEADQMRRVADLAERYADGTLRLTPRQNLLLLNVPKERVAQILEGLESVHLSARASAVIRSLVLCRDAEAGEPGARDLTWRAKELVEYLEKRVPMDQRFTIHVGARRPGCAHSETAEIDLRAERIETDGRAGHLFDVRVKDRLGASRVPADQLRFRIEQFLVGYKRTRQPGESFQAFCSRLNEEQLCQLLCEQPSEPRMSS